MNSIEKVKLSGERVKLIGQLKAKELKGRDKIIASKRIQDIVNLLTGRVTTTVDTVNNDVDLSPFERIVRDNEITLETLQGAVESTKMLLNSATTPQVFIDAVGVVSEKIENGTMLDSLGQDGIDLANQLIFTLTGTKTIPVVDALAQGASTSIVNEGENPTQEQLVANDYKTAKVVIAGMPIAIENPIGSVRRGVDADGNEWKTQMTAHYGYFEGTLGADGDELDVFILPNTPVDYGGRVFVIFQIDKHGNFDEHKVILGATSKVIANQVYRSHYDENFNGQGSIIEMSVDDFKTRAFNNATAMFDSVHQGMLDSWLDDGRFDLMPFIKLNLSRLGKGEKEPRATMREPIVVYVVGSKNYVIHGRKRIDLAVKNSEDYIPSILVDADKGYTQKDIDDAYRKCGNVVHAEALGAMIEHCASKRAEKDLF